MIHALLIVGRVTLWQECMDDIKRFMMDPVTKDGDEWWVFISAHGDPDFADGDPSDIRGLIAKTSPIRVNVCKYVLDPPEPHPMYQHKYESVNSCLRYCSMFYHSWKAFDMLEDVMRERGVTQDQIGWVYKMRADFSPEEPWQLPALPVKEMIYVPGSKYHYVGTPPQWIPDQVGAGSFHSMKLYCSVYPNRENFFFQYGIKIHIPEEILKSHLDVHRIPWCKAACEYHISGHRFAHDDYAGNKDATTARFGQNVPIVNV